MRTHGESSDAMREVTRSIEEAQAAEKWMVAVWFARDGKVELRRTTWSFDKADMPTAVRLLEGNIKSELDGDEIEAPPLPMASLEQLGSVSREQVLPSAVPVIDEAVQQSIAEARRKMAMTAEEVEAEAVDGGYE